MKTMTRRSMLVGVPAVFLAGAAFAQQAAPTPGQPQGGPPNRQRFERAPEYKIFDAPPKTHELSRHDLTIDGRGYRLFVATPKDAAPAQGWPSLWMLDGNSVFDRLTAEDLEHHPGLVVIGVGYPLDQSFDTTARALDYTPVSLTPDPEGGRGRETGGADAFRARLTGPLRHKVEELTSLDPAARVLWGHSYGGLFTLHCLLSDPLAFAGWAPVSASTGFGGGALREMIKTAPLLPDGQRAPLQIMLGDSERRRGSDPNAKTRPNPETIALADLLRARGDLDVEVTVFAGLGHGQTFTASFPKALDLAASIRPA